MSSDSVEEHKGYISKLEELIRLDLRDITKSSVRGAAKK